MTTHRRPAAVIADTFQFSFEGHVQPFVRHRAGDQSVAANRYRVSKAEIGYAMKAAWGARPPVVANLPITVEVTFWQRQIYACDPDNLQKDPA